jgi:hypothetical protein
MISVGSGVREAEPCKPNVGVGPQVEGAGDAGVRLAVLGIVKLGHWSESAAI